MSIHSIAQITRCTHVDDQGVRCITVLCTRDPGPDCYTHEASRPEATAAERRWSLEDLMAEAA